MHGDYRGRLEAWCNPSRSRSRKPRAASSDDAKAARYACPDWATKPHAADPRKDVLFGMAREYGLARDGVAFMLALEKAASQKIKTATHECGRRACGGAARPRIFPVIWQACFHHRPGRGSHGGSGGGTFARKGDAHPHSVCVRRARRQEKSHGLHSNTFEEKDNGKADH